MNGRISLFLGANTCDDFVPYFGELMNSPQVKRAYILKGGPGCGKSGFMRSLSEGCEGANDGGFPALEILCSSDPSSLDGAYMPSGGTLLLDGTAPHALEPRYPGAREELVDLGAFWDSASLQAESEEIISLTSELSPLYPRACRLLRAGRLLMEERDALISSAAREESIARRTRGEASRLPLGPDRPGGMRISCFFTALTHLGYYSTYSGLASACRRRVVIEDELGLSWRWIEAVAERAVAAGEQVLVGYSPLYPRERPVAVLIPGLSIVYLTSSLDTPYPYECEKRIHTATSVDREWLSANRGKLTLLRRVCSSLTGDAAALLGRARALHDRLESLYTPTVDFTSLCRFREKLRRRLSPDE